MSDHPRGDLQLLINGLNLAVTETAHWLAPTMPPAVLLAWLAVIAVVARYAESEYDKRRTPAPAPS